MNLSILAANLNDYLNVFIAIGTLGGIIITGLWKLRGIFKSDVEHTIKKYLEPLTEGMASLHAMVGRHETTLFGTEAKPGLVEQVAYLRGREDAKAETAQLANAAAIAVETLKEKS